MLRYFAVLGVVVAVAVSLFGVLAAGGGNAHAAPSVTVTATTIGLKAPALVTPGPCNTQNGGFTISTANVGAAFPCGDGLDEFTVWIFDFTGHANFLPFTTCLQTSDPPALTRANIELRRSNSDSTITDGTGILDKPPGASNAVVSPLLAGKVTAWPAGGSISHNYEENLLPLIQDNFLDQGSVSPFNSPPFPDPVVQGQIAMQYQDDAIIHYASLRLTCGTPVGGTVDLLTNTDSANSAADVSGSSIASDYAAPAVAAIAAAFVALVAGGWYVRRRRLA